MLKRLFIICTTLAVLGCTSCAPAMAQDVKTKNFYGGLTVSVNADDAGAFIGYENQDERLYYGVEAGYMVSDPENLRVSARAGMEFHQDVVGYAIVGHGWQTSGRNTKGQKGAVYGFGSKYNVDKNFSVGLEFVHQEYLVNSTDNVNLRGIFKF